MRKHFYVAAFILLSSIQVRAEVQLQEGTAYNLVDGSSANDGSIEYLVFSSRIFTEEYCDNHNEDEAVCSFSAEIDLSEKNLLSVVETKKTEGFEIEIRPVKYWEDHSESYWPSSSAGLVYIYRAHGFESFAALGNASNEILNKYEYKKKR